MTVSDTTRFALASNPTPQQLADMALDHDRRMRDQMWRGNLDAAVAAKRERDALCGSIGNPMHITGGEHEHSN